VIITASFGVVITRPYSFKKFGIEQLVRFNLLKELFGA
jgi:hypothetical protein